MKKLLITVYIIVILIFSIPIVSLNTTSIYANKIDKLININCSTLAQRSVFEPDKELAVDSSKFRNGNCGIKEKVHRLGIGTIWFGRKWPMDNETYTYPDDSEIKQYLDTVFDELYNPETLVMVDTAAAYGLTEEKLGQYFAQSRDRDRIEKSLIATKWGEEYNINTGKGDIEHSVSRLKSSVERSMRFLPKIDLLYMHGATDEALRNEKVLEKMRDMKRKKYGGIRYLGLSIADTGVFESLVANDFPKEFDVLQIPAWLLKKYQQDVQKLSMLGVTIVVNSPLRFNREALTNGDMTAQNIYYELLNMPYVNILLTGTRGHLNETISCAGSVLSNKITLSDEAHDLLTKIVNRLSSESKGSQVGQRSAADMIRILFNDILQNEKEKTEARNKIIDVIFESSRDASGRIMEREIKCFRIFVEGFAELELDESFYAEILDEADILLYEAIVLVLDIICSSNRRNNEYYKSNVDAKVKHLIRRHIGSKYFIDRCLTSYNDFSALVYRVVGLEALDKYPTYNITDNAFMLNILNEIGAGQEKKVIIEKLLDGLIISKHQMLSDGSDIESVAAEGRWPDIDLEINEIKRLIQQAVLNANLTEDEQGYYDLYFIKCLSIYDVAAKLNKKKWYVEKRIRRLCRKLYIHVRNIGLSDYRNWRIEHELNWRRRFHADDAGTEKQLRVLPNLWSVKLKRLDDGIEESV